MWELACLRLAISIDTTLQRSTATTTSITTLVERRLELLVTRQDAGLAAVRAAPRWPLPD
ncbi:hypothetical protein C1X27_07150 [Pseudomonas sp. MPR-AND1B]|nr:hypothetical protein C1X24_03620 [Pseudomonas sp. FW305-124]PNB03939.1 hypothetical protein C1X27_07150 [Pseudomonas sp. MPR-AND1B]